MVKRYALRQIEETLKGLKTKPLAVQEQTASPDCMAGLRRCDSWLGS